MRFPSCALSILQPTDYRMYPGTDSKRVQNFIIMMKGLFLFIYLFKLNPLSNKSTCVRNGRYC